MRKIKLNYPTAIVIAGTLRKQIAPTPGDIVVVFDPDSSYIGIITILIGTDDNRRSSPFVAKINQSDDRAFHWTYAYKVPEEYTNAETSNDKSRTKPLAWRRRD